MLKLYIKVQFLLHLNYYLNTNRKLLKISKMKLVILVYYNSNVENK